jgi:hypothetical protein
MKHTNKELLLKGLRYLAGALPLAAIGPIVIFSAFNNQDHPWYIPVLAIGLIAAAASVFLMFKGIGTLMKALFD